jgi:hypothetical protein
MSFRMPYTIEYPSATRAIIDPCATPVTIALKSFSTTPETIHEARFARSHFGAADAEGAADGAAEAEVAADAEAEAEGAADASAVGAAEAVGLGAPPPSSVSAPGPCTAL